jgi:hypothetical protein
MNTTKLFELTHNSDQTEGRGYAVGIGFVNSLAEAKKIVDDPRWKKYCVMGVHTPGSHYYDIREVDVVLFSNAEEFWELHSIEAKKKAALAKLTDEDKVILGLA